MIKLITWVIRNTLPICPLAAGVAAVLCIRPFRRECLAASDAHKVFAPFEPVLPLKLVIAKFAASSVPAVFLGFDLGIEYISTPEADDLPHTAASLLLVIPLFQGFLVSIFPFCVPHGSFTPFAVRGGYIVKQMLAVSVVVIFVCLLPFPFCELPLSLLALVECEDVWENAAGDGFNGVLWNVGIVDELLSSTQGYLLCAARFVSLRGVLVS